MEKLTCFQCNQEGHSAKFCKNHVNNIIENNSLTQLENTESSSISDLNSVEKATPMEESQENIDTFKVPQNKRSMEDNSSVVSASKDKSQKPTHVKKKSKKNDDISPPTFDDFSTKLNPAKEFVENNSDDYILNFSQLCSFLLDTHGISDILSVSRNYTTDNLSLVKMLDDIYSYLTDRNIKSRITRIKNKLLNLPTDITTDEESTQES